MGRRKKKLNLLLAEHYKDKKLRKINRQIITPTKRRYIEGIEPKEFTAYILKNVHNFSYGFIVHVLGVHRNSIKPMIARTCRKLKENIRG